MNILIVGVSGFIGRYLYDVLSQQGHKVTGCSRSEVPNIKWRACDFSQSVDDWDAQLHNIDVVINTVGIYEQSGTQTFALIHEHGPKKLFEACRKNEVRVLQISAIGAEQDQPVTEFLISKRNADQYLLKGTLANVVLYPGIVLGEQGKSTTQLSLLARLYCTPMAFNGETELPLISIRQLTDHIVDIINNWPSTKKTKVIIAKPENMQKLLSDLRTWMGLGKGYYFSIPKSLINLGFHLFPTLSIGAFNRQSMDMLSAYSNKQYEPITNEPASESFLANKATDKFIKELRLRTLFYINLISLSIIWIASGVVSLISLEQSRDLIASVGIEGALGDTIIITAAICDVFLGVFLWHARLRRWIIYMQMGFMLAYIIIISLFLPAFWLHPFAPIIKNLAMFVLLLYVMAEEK